MNKTDTGNVWLNLDYATVYKLSYLHTHLVKNQARCVIEEPVPLPVEDHAAIFMVVGHCDGKQSWLIEEPQNGNTTKALGNLPALLSGHGRGKGNHLCSILCLLLQCFSFLSTSNPQRWSPGLCFPKHTLNFVEGFRNKGLDGFETFNYKSQCWELAAAVADELIC